MKYTYDYRIKAVIPENKCLGKIFLSPPESIIFEEILKNEYVSREKLIKAIYYSNEIEEYKQLLAAHVSRLNKKIKYCEKVVLFNHASYGFKRSKE